MRNLMPDYHSLCINIVHSIFLSPHQQCSPSSSSITSRRQSGAGSLVVEGWGSGDGPLVTNEVRKRSGRWDGRDTGLGWEVMRTRTRVTSMSSRGGDCKEWTGASENFVPQHFSQALFLSTLLKSLQEKKGWFVDQTILARLWTSGLRIQAKDGIQHEPFLQIVFGSLFKRKGPWWTKLCIGLDFF